VSLNRGQAAERRFDSGRPLITPPRATPPRRAEEALTARGDGRSRRPPGRNPRKRPGHRFIDGNGERKASGHVVFVIGGTGLIGGTNQ